MGEQYNLRLLVDDSAVRALEQRLNKIMGISGGSQSGGSSSGGGLLGGGSIAKNILKLSTIAIGVASLVTLVKKISSLVVDSSPVLKAMFKLLNTSLLFVFRPIGDFIGFFLRPIIIFFLRTIAVPWYRLAGPIMRQWGSSIGNNLVAFLTNPFGTLKEWFEGLDWGSLLGLISFLNPLYAIEKSASLFNIDLGEVSAGLGGKFMNLMKSAGDVLSPIFVRILRTFGRLAERLYPVVAPLIDLGLDIAERLLPVWEGIINFFITILEWVKGVIDFFFGGRGEGENTTFNDAGQGGAHSGKGGGSASTIINFYDTHLDATNTEQDFEEKVLSVIERTGRGKAGKI